jgi:hypothetical protein
MMLQMPGAVAEFEHATIVDRVTARRSRQEIRVHVRRRIIPI